MSVRILGRDVENLGADIKLKQGVVPLNFRKLKKDERKLQDNEPIKLKKDFSIFEGFFYLRFEHDGVELAFYDHYGCGYGPDNRYESLIALHSFHYYIYKTFIYCFDEKDLHNDDERILLIKKSFYKHEQKFKKLKKEIRLFEKLQTSYSREPIPEEVRFAVWRRDSGKCVKCGSKGKLEFDHIIPVSKGGSSTERNIQILCEHCNREKSDKI